MSFSDRENAIPLKKLIQDTVCIMKCSFAWLKRLQGKMVTFGRKAVMNTIESCSLLWPIGAHLICHKYAFGNLFSSYKTVPELIWQHTSQMNKYSMLQQDLRIKEDFFSSQGAEDCVKRTGQGAIKVENLLKSENFTTPSPQPIRIQY